MNEGQRAPDQDDRRSPKPKTSRTRSRDRGARALQDSVLDALRRSDRPLSAYDLIGVLADREKPLSPPRMYRALDALIDRHRVHRLETLNAFIACDHAAEPHRNMFLICASCGRVNELSDAAVDEAITHRSAASGFAVGRVNIEVRGLCQACRNAA